MQTYPQGCNIARFGKIFFIILKNLKFISHNMNVIIIVKAGFVKKTASD